MGNMKAESSFAQIFGKFLGNILWSWCSSVASLINIRNSNRFLDFFFCKIMTEVGSLANFGYIWIFLDFLTGRYVRVWTVDFPFYEKDLSLWHTTFELNVLYFTYAISGLAAQCNADCWNWCGRASFFFVWSRKRSHWNHWSIFWSVVWVC